MQSRLIITIINLVANPVLKKSSGDASHRLSILIPAKDEENRIIPLLVSIKDQDYTNFEVIVLDDHSQDATYQKVAQFCETDSRFRIVKGKSLPPGWRGKNYACDQLATYASGEYFLFLDADVRVSEGLFVSSINTMKKGRLSLLSVIPNQLMYSFGEQVTIPLMHYLMLSMLPIPLISQSPFSFISAACGQFMLFRADEYQINRWHEKVRNEVVEDLCIAGEVKKQRLKQELLLSQGVLSCRMYTNLQESLTGLSRSLPFVFKNSGLLGFLFLGFLSYGPLYCLYTGHYIYLAVIVFVLIVLRTTVSHLSGQQSVKNLLFHPIQLLMLGWIFILFTYNRYAGSIQWKGRIIDLT